jgi:HlyD family secretion protein
MKRWIMVPAALLVVAIIFGAGYMGFASSQSGEKPAVQAPPTVPVGKGDVVLSVTAPGTAVATRQVDLSMGVAGQLGQVLVKAGDAVKQGQVLASMGDPASFEAAVAAARLQVAQTQKALDDLLSGAPQVSAQAQLDLVQAEKAVTEAQTARDLLNYDRGQNGNADAAWAEYYLAQEAYNRALDHFNQFANLDASDPMRASAQTALVAAQQVLQARRATVDWYTSGPSASDIAQADASLSLAKARQAAAQLKWTRVKDGPDAQSLENARATLANAQAGLTNAQSDLQKLQLKAPYDGVVLDVSATAGQNVGAGNTVLTLTDPKALEVKATVVEEDFPLVVVGQPVTLYFDALPAETITGKVARIVPKRMSGAQANYQIAITLDSVPEHLVDGMSVDASIVIDQRQNALRLSRSLVRARSDGTAQLDVWNGLTTEKRTIKIGLKGDTYTEVLEGLDEGELVVAK